ncbi:unnamed protein product [Diabrotica balteata]|uniref:Uncharacterized protein n=1 Tax=Diabrotica balteata TaxID=107213 RepID=A0A9N9SUL1_DIABA|nr:unnamed protein product [Diabrotica balteata]
MNDININISVGSKKRKTEGPVANAASEVAVLGHVHLNPMISMRQLAATSIINRTSVQVILKMNKFHSFKIHLLQKLNGDDYDRSL